MFLDYFSFFCLRLAHPVPVAPNAVSDSEQYLVFWIAHPISPETMSLSSGKSGSKKLSYQNSFICLLLVASSMLTVIVLSKCHSVPCLSSTSTSNVALVSLNLVSSLFVVQRLYGFLDNVYDIMIVFLSSAFVIHTILIVIIASPRFTCYYIYIFVEIEQVDTPYA